ncbi:MAG: universal stress protein [Acidimicrobiales bacterium]
MTSTSAASSSEAAAPETAPGIERAQGDHERGDVVVGVDGSHASRSALRFAAAEARLRGARLVVLTATVGAAVTGAVDAATRATDPDMASMVTALMAPAVHATLRHFPAPVDLARDLAEAMVHQELGDAPRLAVRVEPYDGTPAKALVERSHSADLVVVGARGQGGFEGLRLGSVADQVRRHASCTVVVVHGTSLPAATALPATDAPPRPVVVGVDDSPGARRALRFALREVRLRAATLVVVSAYRPSDRLELESLAGPHDAPGPDPQPALAAAAVERMLDAEPGAAEVHRDLEIRPGAPAAMLLDAARRRSPSLLVVGARGLGGFAGLLLGSVSESVSRHADCPVAVVRP